MLYNPKWEEKINVAPTWRSVLFRAAEIVRERGLAKNHLRDGLGRVCVHGAIQVVIDGNTYPDHRMGPLEIESCQALCNYLQQTGAEGIVAYGAAHWNNEPSRTADEVIAALEGAARS